MYVSLLSHAAVRRIN